MIYRLFRLFQIYKFIDLYKIFSKKYISNKFFISPWREKPKNFWILLNFILDQKKPKSILELGSGKSTLYFFKYISKNKNSKFITLEHHYLWYRKQLKIVKNNFEKKLTNCVKFCKITDDWYDFNSDEKFDFIFLDGPNQNSFLKKNKSKRDSKIAINFFKKKIKNCKTLIVDDTHRQSVKKLSKKINLQLKPIEINYNQSNDLTIFVDQSTKIKIVAFLKKISKLKKKKYILI